MRLSGKNLKRGADTDVAIGVEGGNGCQDSFEGRKRFGWPLRDVERKHCTPKSAFNPACVLDW